MSDWRRLFTAVLFVGLFGMAARNATDPDLWWHLKTGEWIAQHHAVPHTDPFSYPRAGQTWIAHEWLSDLVIYGLLRARGWGGLIVAFAAVICAALWWLFLRCRGELLPAIVMTLWGAWATTPVWGVRPQILSFALASLWLLILERSEQKRHLLWWTLPLTVLWVNLHAGFALGLTFLAVYLAGDLLEKTRRGGWIGNLALALGADLLLVAVNPNGLKMFWYPIETLRSQAMQRHIAEWASPNFHSADYVPFLLLLLTTFAILTWTRGPVRPRDILLLLAGTFAALTSIRMIPVFVLVAAPLISRRIAISRGVAIPDRAARPAPPSTPLRPVLNGAVLLAVAAFAVIHTAITIRRQPQVEAARFPSRAVDYLAAHPPDGPVFNNYDWGGYLIFRLYPRTPVFIDGRADLYGNSLMQEFLSAYYLQGSWQEPLAQWKVGTVIAAPDAALTAGLRHATDWSAVYEDSQAIIFMKMRQSDAGTTDGRIEGRCHPAGRTPVDPAGRSSGVQESASSSPTCGV